MSFETGLTLKHEIGSGQFGKVWLGEDPTQGVVAVKIPHQYAGEPDAAWLRRRDHLVTEGENLRKAKHQNVVEVYYSIRSSSGEPHLVMQHCNGGCLSRRYQDGPIPLDEVKNIATCVTLGLGAIHARGLLHRDLKPSNIMEDGSVYKIGDFGLVTDEIIHGYAAKAGYNDHLAPEVHQYGVTSAKTDIWALGMTLYRLMHGHGWYSGFPQPRTTVPAGNFARNLQWLSHIPDDWRRFIRKMLHDDSAQRYQTTEQVLTALARLSTQFAWRCTFDPLKTTWVLPRGSRNVRVELTSVDGKSWRWRAWTEPAIGSGRRYGRGGSDGPLKWPAAQAELQAFFGNFT
jgi:eukaryotic-like serine/threonine-protein kinase